MFERFTEKARRVIFFARYEASQFGSPIIETEHLFLGILREDKVLTGRILPRSVSAEVVRGQIEQRTVFRNKVSTAIDLPLSNESKRVLAYAAEEAERLHHQFVGTDHLLLGLLRETKGLAAELLERYGVDAAVVRAGIRDDANSQLYQRGSPSFPTRHFGKYRGVVVNNMDPEQLGRVLTKVPALPSAAELNWALPCVPYPAGGSPTLAVPPVGASVWIEFEGGDLDFPIWSGCFWNSGQQALLLSE